MGLSGRREATTAPTVVNVEEASKTKMTIMPEPLLAPVEEAVAAGAAARRHRADLWDLAVGESRTLPPRHRVGE